MRSLHLAHENNSEIKAAHSEKSERSKTETERHNGMKRKGQFVYMSLAII
jgi:hypothetical protein